MKKTVVFAGILFFLVISGGVSKSGEKSVLDRLNEKEPLYTAYNIWQVGSQHMKCINYKLGNNILPAGTKIKDVKIRKLEDENVYRSESDFVRWDSITFKTAEEGKSFRIYFVKPWHPGKTIRDYAEYMFTEKNFEELTAGLSKNEISAIRTGSIARGMCKEAVLISYGYPPEHKTNSLENQTWTYWSSKSRRIKVVFDESGKTRKADKL